MLEGLVRTGPGLALLYRLSRNGQSSSAPPNSRGTEDRFTQDEIDKAMMSERYNTDADYRDRIRAAYEKMSGGTQVSGGVSNKIDYFGA